MEGNKAASLDITECEILQERPLSPPLKSEKRNWLRHQCGRVKTKLFARSQYLFLQESYDQNPKGKVEWLWVLVCAIVIGLLIADLLVRTIPWPSLNNGTMDYSQAPIILIGDSITQYGYVANRMGWTTMMSCSYALRYDGTCQ